MEYKNKKNLKIGIVIIIISALIGWYYLTVNSAAKVALISIKQINPVSGAMLTGKAVPTKVNLLYKKVRMKVKEVIAVPGTYVKKGDLLITYYGVTKDGYNEMLDSEVREELNEKMILVDSLKKKLIGMNLESQVLQVQLHDAKNTERVMAELLDNDRATSSEVVGAKSAVMLTNLEYQKVLKEISILKKTIALKSIVIEKELIERGTNTLAPEDGLILKVAVSDGQNTIPANTLITFVNKDSGIQIEFKIPESIVKNVNIDDKVIVTKLFLKKDKDNKDFKTSGFISELSSVGTDLEDNGSNFRGLIGEITVEEINKFKIQDEVSVEILEDNYQYSGGASTLSIFNISEDESIGYIYIAEDGRAKKIEVKLGRKVKHQYEILDLPIGTKLIGDPYSVKNNQKIKIIETREEVSDSLGG
jgi:hypothetical protein